MKDTIETTENKTELTSQRSSKAWVITHYLSIAVIAVCILIPFLVFGAVSIEEPDAGIALLVLSFFPLVLVAPLATLVSVVAGAVASIRMQPGLGRGFVITTTVLVGLLFLPVLLILLI